jgi:hypothetical protein
MSSYTWLGERKTLFICSIHWYILSPESILTPQGRGNTYLSAKLKDILGDNFLENFHQQVVRAARDQPGTSNNQDVAALNTRVRELEAKLASVQADSSGVQNNVDNDLFGTHGSD